VNGPNVGEREQQWLSAFNQGDASALARFYVSDGRILSSRAGIISGRTAIETFYEGIVAMGAFMTVRPLTQHESGKE
jgi:ketosteroid isomerase-like protein